MRSPLTVNSQDDISVEIKKFGHSVSRAFNTLKRGLNAASAARVYPGDKDALKSVASDK